MHYLRFPSFLRVLCRQVPKLLNALQQMEQGRLEAFVVQSKRYMELRRQHSSRMARLLENLEGCFTGLDVEMALGNFVQDMQDKVARFSQSLHP